MLFKIAESLEPIKLEEYDSNSSIVSEGALEQFRKVAAELKQIAPKAKDFLYFSTVMMHAAEASLYDDDGKLLKDSSGKDVEAHWDKKGDSWKWMCSNPSIKPYKNNNNDIFPESELIKAHKKWIGRPLCLDHKSSSVDMIRGIIVDTYYDSPKKRIIALCALDKVNYPDLARKVETGVSNNVSMGVAVGEAICTDCGAVARVEADFCNHMRNKSCYGEINVGLNPIELSIVVNGADPKAKIKHIIAAANSLAQYVEMKKAYADHKPISPDAIQEIIVMLQNLKTEAEGCKEEPSHDESADEKDENDTQEAAVKPMATATTTVEDTTIKVAIAGIEEKISVLARELSKLTSEESNNMTTSKRAYFQGAGGVNEPTPGKPKYEKEEADSVRNTEDKHMVGVQDMGAVDGMFPGDEQKKKSLQRAAAEQEERAMKREAALSRAKEALQRKAYFQNGDDKASNPNTPTPGKAKYEKEDAESTRNKEDKQMVGAPPFPGVGKIDGLYDDDEATKKKLLRAKLKATFVKAASPNGSLNRGDSRWSIYADDRLILTATVAEISGNRVDSLYDSIATKEFGKSLLAKLKTEKFEKVAAQLKGAAENEMAPPAPPAPMPGAQGAPPPPAEGEGGAPTAGMPADMGGDPKEQEGEIISKLEETLQEATNLVGDLAEAHNADTNKEGDELTGFEELAQQPGAEEVASAAPPGAPTTASLVMLQRKLSKAIRAGIKTTVGDLRGHIEELKLAHSLMTDNIRMSDPDTRESVNDIVVDAINDAKHTIADSYRLMGAFVKYARGTEALVKRANRDVAMIKRAQAKEEGGVMTFPGDTLYSGSGKAPAPKPLQKGDGAKAAQGLADAMGPSKATATPVKPTPKPAPKPATDASSADDVSWVDDDVSDADDMNDIDVDINEVRPEPGTVEATTPKGDKLKINVEDANKLAFDLSTKEGRAAWRTKLAEKGMQYSDMLNKAHPGNGFTTQLDTKPTGDLAKVETLEETHQAMLDVANAPPKVRKMAEEIQKYVTAGKIDPDKDFPMLISQGLDPAAAKYWKQYWGEAKDGGSQFAADLIKEHAAFKQAEEQNVYRVKIARAYDMAYEMAERNMIGSDHSAINEQVNEIMNWGDDNFDSLKRLIARQPVQKRASAMPQVGMLGMSEVIVPAPAAEPSDLRTALNAIFSNKKY